MRKKSFAMAQEKSREERLALLRDKAWNQTYTKMWGNAYRGFLLNNSDDLTEGCSEKEMGIMDTYVRKCRSGIKFAFFTVNPTDDTHVDNFKIKIDKCLRKCWVGDWLYCIEQRGGAYETRGDGMHAHILIKLSKYKRPSDCKREVYNTFKNIVGNEMHVDMRSGMDCKNFVKYIYGIKKGEEKDDLLKFDRIWKAEECLDDVYYKSEENDWREYLPDSSLPPPSGEGVKEESIIVGLDSEEEREIELYGEETIYDLNNWVDVDDC